MFDAIKKLFNNNNNIIIVRSLGDIISYTITLCRYEETVLYYNELIQFFAYYKI